MKTIIAGSRTITNRTVVENAIEQSGIKITEVVSGCANGVDFQGEVWAHSHGIPVKQFPAAWGELGKAAGPIRNAEMAEYAEALICIHNGSRGSLHMLKVARGKGLRVFEVDLRLETHNQITQSTVKVLSVEGVLGP